MTDDDAATWPIGVDGCGIPVYATQLRRAALAFARFATLAGVSTADAAALARRARRNDRTSRVRRPEPARFDTVLMQAGDGRFACKGGAEGVHRRRGHRRRTRLRFEGRVDGAGARRGPATIAALASAGDA